MCRYLPCMLYIFSSFSFHLHAQTGGCTDPVATNYNTAATVNDGRCQYPAYSVTPSLSQALPETIFETSGLAFWDDKLWTLNDDTDINLYAFYPDSPTLLEAYPLTGSKNIDWEELVQDNNYFYIGDIGNNANGNRTNLQILRVAKQTLADSLPLIDTIGFAYATQDDFSPTGANSTNYDCEAFIVSNDSIFLFTKEWESNKTRLFSLPKTPGNYLANFRDEFDTEGLVTGATWLQEKKLLVLCGYSQLLQPFLWLLYDYTGNNFFNGNKRKVDVNLPLHQVEAITTTDGLNYFLTNEQFKISQISITHKLHSLNLENLLGSYLNSIVTGTRSVPDNSEIFVYPNPFTESVFITSAMFGYHYTLYSLSGSILSSGSYPDGPLLLSGLHKGAYLLRIGSNTESKTHVLIKRY